MTSEACFLQVTAETKAPTQKRNLVAPEVGRTQLPCRTSAKA